jgi:hypothetical protein
MSGSLRRDSSEMKRARDGLPSEAPAPTSTSAPVHVRDSGRPDDEAAPASSLRFEGPTVTQPPSWEPEAPTGTRPKERSVRPAVSVDDVGAAAVKIASTTPRQSAPKLIASRATIAKAPIDTRTAFVLSLVDGRNSVEAIIDMSGMRADEVNTILARLGRLGLITLP